MLNSNLSALPSSAVAQKYIENPLLLSDYKFDLRLYVLITSCDPLSIYLFKDGLVRMATEKYEKPNSNNCGNLQMHLTNYTVNKTSEQFEESTQSESFEGSKRSFAAFLNHLKTDRGEDNVNKMLDDIKDLITKTIIGVQPTLNSLNKSSFPKETGAFELVGFDVLIDQNLKPWIMEVNQSPSLSIDLPIDLDIKKKLIEETIKLVQIKQSESFWNIYPANKTQRYRHLFTFPFPEELFGGGFLDTSSVMNLMSAIRSSKQ
eukprot:TRINITY_DN5835_c0_g1_i1.p1 TRINITY_DN5835_c0_g1~~TRINITY_DN5835_c0_g1_i1.p1  ORF type:complete len:261 (-),score=66.12 TRINITY_DN5835_c0_g1_i1:66-848(-)